MMSIFFFFFQAEDGIRDKLVTGVQTCALPISGGKSSGVAQDGRRCGKDSRGKDPAELSFAGRWPHQERRHHRGDCEDTRTVRASVTHANLLRSVGSRSTVARPIRAFGERAVYCAVNRFPLSVHACPSSQATASYARNN